MRSVGPVAEVALDRILNHLAELLQRVRLGKDIVTQSPRAKAPVGLVFTDFEDDFCDVHDMEGSLRPEPQSKAHKNIVCSRPGPTDAMDSLAPVSSEIALR